jgi:adenosylcobinamide-GDP ribazoletransferase
MNGDPRRSYSPATAPHPGPLPASGEREGPAKREGEGHIADDKAGDRRGRTSGFAAATGFLTRIPVVAVPPEDGQLAAAAWAFPLVGAGIGAVTAFVLLVAQLLGLGPWSRALLAVLAGLVLTGALHEDGLADTADGLCGGDREARLAIMRDSRLGTFGGLALIISVGLRAAALAQLAEAFYGGLALIAAHALSRGLLPAVMRLMTPARSDGLAAAAGRPASATAVIAVAIGAVISILALGPLRGALAALLATLAIAATALLAQRRLGGYTGDILGACQQVAEIVVLLVAAPL